MKYVLKNCTNIEDWIVGKAISRREQDPSLPPFIYPYNLGKINNLKLVGISFIRIYYTLYQQSLITIFIVQMINHCLFLNRFLLREMVFIGQYVKIVMNMI